MICLLPNCCFLSETSRMLEIYLPRRARRWIQNAAPAKVGCLHGRL
jgi:hypothetical protein